jgi:type IV pilus assembly protein PilV
MIRVPSLRRQRGIGMIEVLIAVLVVSIGFLGMAALQARALSTNNSAMARSMATVASYSILDAMRADVVNAKLGSYNGTVTANACANVSAATALATSQLQQWCSELGNTLGAGAGSTASTTTGTINCSVVGDCTITIQFDDSRAGVGGSSTQKVVTETGL